MKHLFKFVFFLSAIALCFVPASFAIPVNNDIALTVFDEQVLVREQVVYTRKSDDPSPLDQKEDHLHVSTVFAYGITQDLSVQLTYPFMIQEIEETRNGQRVKRKTSGFGDLKAVGKFEFFENDSLGKTENAAIIAGLQMPTGDTDDEDRYGKLSRDLQVGKGSWNPIAGLAYNWETFRHEFDASFSYMLHTEGHGYEFGDMLHHNASYQFRVWPWSLDGIEGLPGYWFVGVELNGVWHQKDKDRGRTVDASGGYTLYGSPTLQFISRRFIWESSIQLPMIQVTNGEQSETDLMLRTGFRVQF